VTKSSASAYSASDPQAAVVRAGPLCLGAQDVHVWLCLRSRFAGSDTFKRHVLSRYAAVMPADWEFSRGAQGKPYLTDPSHALDFNLSHSGDWLACAVTAGVPVGVDIEQCNPQRNPQRDVMTLARRFFRAEEVEALASCGPEQQRDQFYNLWTLKESAVKARGGVLVSGLDSRGFTVVFNNEPLSGCGRIALTTPDDTDTAHYCLLHMQPDYRLALCWLPDSVLLPRVQVFELCDGNVTRTSDQPLRASTWSESAVVNRHE
jgi:4'-phosphopantetheinyl transferase